MGKIVNINENDLKRIVKRVLNERQQLNEEVLTIALWVAGSAIAANIGKDVYNWWSSGEPRQRASSTFEMCDRGGVQGKPIDSQEKHEGLAKEYHTACPGTGYLTSCDEDEMIDILSEIPSLPDLCGVIKEFKTQGHGSMWDITKSAMESEEYWEKVNEALTPAFRKTQEANKENEDGTSSEEKPGGGNTSSSTASGDGSVSDLQRLLKDKGFDVGSSGVDGRFGKDTLAATIKALRSLK
jgi:hypothetical protein